MQIFSQLTGLLARNVLRDFVIVDPEKTEPWLFIMSDYCHYGAHAIHQNHSSMIISDKDEHHDTNLNNWNYLLHIEPANLHQPPTLNARAFYVILQSCGDDANRQSSPIYYQRNVSQDVVIVYPEWTEPWSFIVIYYCHYDIHPIHQEQPSTIITVKEWKIMIRIDVIEIDY